MTQYNTLNVKFSNSKLNKLKLGIKYGTGVTLKISSNVVGDSNDENDFPHKLSLTNAQALRLRKAFANGPSANKKLSKTQLHKIRKSSRILGLLLLKTGLPLIANVLKPLAKSVLTPFGLTAVASATDATIHNKMFGSGNTTSIISNELINDIMDIVKSLKESGLLIKGVSEAIKNEAKEQKGEFIGMLLGILGATLFGNLLTGKGSIRAGAGTIRAGQDF